MTVNRCIEIFREIGFSESRIAYLLGNMPKCLSIQELEEDMLRRIATKSMKEIPNSVYDVR